MFKNMKNDESGFSLVEVSLAVGIMAMLTAMAVPTFTGMLPAVQEKADAQESKNCLIDNKINELSAVSNGNTYNENACATTTP